MQMESEMEETVKNMEHFWDQAMQNLKQVIEKGAFPLPNFPGSKGEENHYRCK